MELVDRNGIRLATDLQESFFSQLPEVTFATLKASILCCT
jgi:hypothetical protein